MSAAPVPSFLKRAIRRRSTVRGDRGSPNTAPTGSAGLHRVEVVAPDPKGAALLVAYAAPLFPAAIAPGTSTTVHLQPPVGGGRWVIDLLALVERWLEAAPLSHAEVGYGGRNYLIRSSSRVGDLVAVPPSTATLNGGSSNGFHPAR